MTKFKLFHLKNEMIFANAFANLFAVTFVHKLMFRAEPLPAEIWEIPIVKVTDTIFTPLAFLFVLVMTLRYERPIRLYLNAKFKRSEVSAELENRARRKMLNEPFFLMALGLSMWMFSAIIWPIIYWSHGFGSDLMQRALLLSLSTGSITVIVAFFLLEHISQKRLAPHFFPDGGLTAIPKTLRIRIRTRLVALLFACNLIPLLTILHLFHRVSLKYSDPALAIQQLRPVIFTNTFIFIGFGMCLTMLVGRNLTMPFKEIILTLRGVRNGRFDKKVQVTSNDEIGYTGDVINEMTAGLKERERMQQALNLVREVQQNLLPKNNMKVNGLDIAGKSVYCDETGGDYYDFISIGDNDKQKIGVVIGDVSGHGISSALLMATVRSSLRQRASLPGSTAKIISDVNRQLVKDVEDSGQFMTMFFLALDTATRQLEWVRAGHDPGLIYDPGSDSFSALGGSGIALGVDAEWIYEDNKKTDFSNGEIIFLSTDGIWEARNKNGEMLGKEPILSTIRQNSSSEATQIIDAIFDILDKFIGEVKIEDDITSVVIKMQD
jgi:sigma-B regulation protein RsbU (phosphoserine phosphatase)